MDTITFTKTAAPAWLLAMWKEIDDKTFGKGFDCFAENAVCNLGVADWHGREAIRDNLRQFIDKGFTAHHDVVEYRDSPLPKVFHGKVGMKFNDPSLKPVRPTMTHFFYMDEKEPTKVKHWIGSVGPTGFYFQAKVRALTESRRHDDKHRFLPVRCDRSWDHFHRLPLSVGTFKSSHGLWRTSWRRAAFASLSIRQGYS
jgi:hypothetical protein